MRLTGRGIGLLAGGIASYAAGLFAGYPVFRMFGGLALGVLVAAVVFALRVPRVEVTRELHPDRVERGRPALATLRVRNPGDRSQAPFLAHDSAGPVRRKIRVKRLPPGGEATYRYELATTRRGRLDIGPLVLERTDPLGLARNRLTAGNRATLWVHPRRHRARTVVAGRPRHHHEGRVADDSLRGSSDLRDVRPYTVGDEVRHLHWKATARTGELMVRDYADPDQPRLSLLLDTREGALPGEVFEDAVEVAASVLYAAAMAGHRCRLLTSAGTDLATAGGPVAARQVLDELCEVAPGAPSGAPLVPPVLTRGRSSGGGAIVLVTGKRGAPRHLAPLIDRYSSVTVVALAPARGVMPALNARVILGRDSADALRQWNGVFA